MLYTIAMINPEKAEHLREYRVRPDTILERVLDSITPPLLGLVGAVALDFILDSPFDTGSAAILGGTAGFIHLFHRKDYEIVDSPPKQ